MNILITRNFDDEDKNILVEFSSHIGSAIARWAGEKPLDKTHYDVEIEIPLILTWGKDIVDSSGDTFYIETSNGFTYLRGKLISFEEDRRAIVQLGNSLVLAEVEGNIPTEQIFVEIKIEYIILHNINI